jgi:hypothetical protein
MKLLILLGGLIGFATGIGLGLLREKSMASTVLHACVVMYGGGWLMRWWGRACLRNLRLAGQEELPYEQKRVR